MTASLLRKTFMRLVTFESEQGESRIGLHQGGDEYVDLNASNSKIPTSMLAFLADTKRNLAMAAEVLDRGNAVQANFKRLLAPVPRPPKVICVGLNYRDHAEETGAAIPDDPVIFNKFPSVVIAPEEDIELPPVSDRVDYEAELVVVIGKTAKNVPVESALEHVVGYTAGHDVSARDWQATRGGKQWLLGKSFDTFAPLGPAIVTRDEIPDPHHLAVKFRLNGVTLQDSSTAQMIFKVDFLVSHLSQVFTLEPGDIIYTGTPPGVGFVRQPPVFLKPGDECEVEIEKIGVLRNRCRAAQG